jgi:hypothetical protein
MLPVLAELFIKGDHIELHGFRNANQLSGTVRFDPRAKRMRITAAGQPKEIEYGYEFKGDWLTLTDTDKVEISLHKRPVVLNPLANARVVLVTAEGINDAGDLLVTEYTVLRAGRMGATYYQPEKRSLKTKAAAVFVVGEKGLKKTTVDEARRLIRKDTPIVVAYREEERPSQHQGHKLWKEVGAPVPDSDVVGQTLSRLLRPGTLVFILPARESVPLP